MQGYNPTKYYCSECDRCLKKWLVINTNEKTEEYKPNYEIHYYPDPTDKWYQFYRYPVIDWIWFVLWKLRGCK